MKTIMARYVWIAAVLLTCIGPVYAQDAIVPHFGTGFVFLRQSNNGVFFIGHPSRDGRYVVGTSHSPPLINAGDQLNLWDISTADPEGHPTEPDPAGTFDLGPWQDTPFSGGSFAISPDSRTVALALDNRLLLLSTPDLTLQRQFDIEDAHADGTADMLAWSDDNQAAAVLYPDQAVVVDVGSDTLYTHPINKPALSQITEYVNGSWVFGFETAFMVCSRYLESCTDYPLNDQLIRIYPQTATLLTGQAFGSGDHATRLWQMDESGVFKVVETLTGDGIIDGLSPDGAYITIRRMTEGGSPEYPYWSLYRRYPQTFIRELDTIQPPMWLNDEGYFLVGKSLFHISQPQVPLDDIPNLIDIGFAASDEAINAKIAFYPENMGYLNPTADGRWFMWHVGGTAFMIPVILAVQKNTPQL